jgi:hypothetical protein
MFFSYQNIDFPFLFVETLGAFLFHSPFVNTFSLSFNAPSLSGLWNFVDK